MITGDGSPALRYEEVAATAIIVAVIFASASSSRGRQGKVATGVAL